MAITNTTTVEYIFNTLTQFETKVAGNNLIAGGLYFVENTVRLAKTGNTYNVIGGMQVGTPPALADAEVGIFYYDPTSGILQFVSDDKYVYLTAGVTSIKYGTGTDAGKIFFVRHDGTEIELTLPKTTVIDDADPSDMVLPTEKAVVEYVEAQVGALIGGIRPMGVLIPGTTTIASAKQGDMYRVNAAGTYLSVPVEVGDWVVFITNTTSPQQAHFVVYPGVENPAVDSLDSTSTVLPLAANQGRVLKGLIDDLDEAKIGKIEDADGGKVAITTAEGEVSESAFTLNSTDTMNTDPETASLNKIPNERQIANALQAVAAGAVKYWQTS
jgi:hypothetical protein